MRGGKWHVMPTPGSLNGCVWSHGAIGVDDLRQPLPRKLREQLRSRTLEWGITTEDLPEESNEIVLDPRAHRLRRDPCCRRSSTRSARTPRKLLDFHIARAVEAHEAAGALSTEVVPVVRDSGWHLLGSARMGEDRSESVVDQWGRSHDVPNLFVFDGSNFVTSTGVNPTATIMAIALRAARHLVDNRHNQVSASSAPQRNP